MSIFEPIFEALNERGVRYVVVGGVAVVLHGHARLTLDLDLVIDLSPAEALKTVEVLADAGLTPSIPVDPRDFADPVIRESWIREKNMQVFSMRDPDDLRRRVDLFVSEPVPFEDLWARSVVVEIGTTAVRVAAIQDLITMKGIAGREQDLSDIAALTEIEEYRRGQPR